jgi:hypothetical protein
MPQPSPELVALSRIPLLDVVVTDPEGNKVSGEFVNYRSLTLGPQWRRRYRRDWSFCPERPTAGERRFRQAVDACGATSY